MRCSKSFLIIVFLLLLVSCSNSTYTNHKYKYKLTIPDNYTLIDNARLTEQAIQTTQRVKSEGGLPIYENADCTFYNNNSFGPIFDTITVTTLTKPFSMNQIKQSQDIIEAMFLNLLIQNYTDVKITSSSFVQYKFGQAYKADFSFYYKDLECFGSIVLLTSNILFSNLITLICPKSHQLECEHTFTNLVNSYKKFF